MTLAIVGGYRLVRKVGHGPRAEVWLGHPVDEAALPAVLKLFAPTTSAAAVSAEIEALARSAGPHVVAVLDLATAADGRVALVLERLSPHTLASVLTARPGLHPGEAVTALAPILQAVSRMHDAGVSHGALRSTAIGFTDHGAPVVACFGSAVVALDSPTPERRGRDAGVVEDLRALRELCRDVLEPIPGSEEVLAWIDENAHGPAWPTAFGPRLFAWAAPRPIDFARRDAASVRAVAPAPLRPRGRSTAAGALLDRMAALISADWFERVRRQATIVRPRFWIAGGAVAAALVAAVAVLPAPSSDASSSTVAPTPTASASSSPGESDAVTGDDPVAAIKVLWATRERCIRDLSVLCLDAVAQPGSSALAQDQQLIRELQQGAEAPVLGSLETVSLEESLGGTALLVVTAANAEPASVLVMRSEAGWRIRDYLDGG